MFRMNELKSAVLSGTSSTPTSVPPAAFRSSRELFRMSWPKAKDAVM